MSHVIVTCEAHGRTVMLTRHTLAHTDDSSPCLATTFHVSESGATPAYVAGVLEAQDANRRRFRGRIRPL